MFVVSLSTTTLSLLALVLFLFSSVSSFSLILFSLCVTIFLLRTTDHTSLFVCVWTFHIKIRFPSFLSAQSFIALLNVTLSMFRFLHCSVLVAHLLTLVY